MKPGVTAAAATRARRKAREPNRICRKCGTPFYAPPSLVRKGWGNHCSIKCARAGEGNSRFIHNDVVCRGCGKAFHVKLSQMNKGKGKVYCSGACRDAVVKATKVCPACSKSFSVPSCHANKRTFCSKACRSAAAISATPNRVCRTCGRPFFEKPSDLKRRAGVGTFCSRVCMQGSRKGITRDGVVCSHLEAALYDQLKAAQLTDGLVREHKFHPIRKWRFDFAWPSQDVAVEVQGGIWLGKRGRHTSGTGMARDIEKSNSAALLGWRLFAYTADMISSGQAVEQLGRVLRYVPSQIRTGEAANQIQRIVDNATKQE